MFELLLIIFAAAVSLFMIYVWPLVRHFMNYRKERDMLEKKFNRLWRSRNDLMVSTPFSLIALTFSLFSLVQGHLDWAIAREDPPKDVEMIGREIERLDREMEQLNSDIIALEKTRFDVNAFVPMQSIKSMR